METLSFDHADPQVVAQDVEEWTENQLDRLRQKDKARMQVALMVEESLQALLEHADKTVASRYTARHTASSTS